MSSAGATRATTNRTEMSPAAKRAVRWVVAVAVLVILGFALRDRLAAVPDALRDLQPRWGLVALASLIVLGAYLVLVETGRIVLAEFGGILSFSAAARIWFISNLTRYIPFAPPGVQLGTAAAMAKQQNVTYIAKGAADLLMTIISMLTGGAVFLATGARALTLDGRAKLLITMAAMLLLAS